ncbi:MAG: fibronectin type III domain-containing protein, partial [Verrucomicrobiota bacterium]|nr:fibronectin type III domain-containing protein [Verrucomicrobiota bacterium]
MSAGQISLRNTFIVLLIWPLIIRTALAAPDPPHILTAEAPVFGEIAIEWSDDSNDEDSYILQVRTSPQADWSSLGSFNSESKDVTLTGGDPTTNYEFRILSVNESGQSASKTASIIMPDKFLNNPFANISQGKIFSLQLIANNHSKSQSITYQASPLPDGLLIDSRTGIISGTALEDGYFNVILRAEYSSPEAPPSLARLALRITPALKVPQLKEAIPDIKMIISESPIIINLDSYFQDQDTRIAIQLNTNHGNM